MSAIVTATELPNRDENEETVEISTTIPQQQATMPPNVTETEPLSSNVASVNFMIFKFT